MTAEHKIELYRRAAAYILDWQESGICLGLQRAHETMTGERIAVKEMRYHFPELYAYRPVTALWNFYWWDLRDKAIRVKIINEIIEKLSKQ